MPYRFLDTTQYMFNPLALQSLLVALGVFCLGIFALGRERESPVSMAFFMMTVTISIWLFAFSKMYSAIDGHTAMWWAKFAYLGIAFIPAAMYNYTALLLQDYEMVRKRVLAAWFLSAIFFTLIITTDMLFGSLYHYSWGFYPKFRVTSIPFLLYFFGVIIVLVHRFWTGYSTVINGPVLLLRARKMSLILIVLGCLASVDFVATSGIPLYPFGYIPVFLFVVLSAYSILHHQLLAITPAFAARQIIDIMNDALIVLDRQGIVRVVNQATCTLFGCREKDLVDKQPTIGMANCISFAEELKSIIKEGTVRNVELDCRPQGNIHHTLSLSTSIMRDKTGEPLAIVCVLRDITDLKRAVKEREELIVQLKEALANVKQLSGMLPICATCKKIRDDQGYWQQIEAYISDHSEAEFTHGMCPACAEIMYAELAEMNNG